MTICEQTQGRKCDVGWNYITQTEWHNMIPGSMNTQHKKFQCQGANNFRETDVLSDSD